MVYEVVLQEAASTVEVSGRTAAIVQKGSVARPRASGRAVAPPDPLVAAIVARAGRIAANLEILHGPPRWQEETRRSRGPAQLLPAALDDDGAWVEGASSPSDTSSQLGEFELRFEARSLPAVRSCAER